MPNSRVRAYTPGHDFIHFFGGESTGSRQYRPFPCCHRALFTKQRDCRPVSCRISRTCTKFIIDYRMCPLVFASFLLASASGSVANVCQVDILVLGEKIGIGLVHGLTLASWSCLVTTSKREVGFFDSCG